MAIRCSECRRDIGFEEERGLILDRTVCMPCLMLTEIAWYEWGADLMRGLAKPQPEPQRGRRIKPAPSLEQRDEWERGFMVRPRGLNG